MLSQHASSFQSAELLAGLVVGSLVAAPYSAKKINAPANSSVDNAKLLMVVVVVWFFSSFQI
jgi:hypothetical protein